MSLSGHLWTIAPTLKHRVRPVVAPASEPWECTVDDAAVGALTLRGQGRHVEGAEDCVLVVHGLGGGPDAFYCARMAAAADAEGMSCVRMSLRGADRQGEDFYHGGLVDDIDAALASPALSPYRRLYVVGYSLGGHVTLRHALLRPEPRLRAVAALCAPLDLGLSGQAIDRRRAVVYRGHVLAGLKEIYSQVARRRDVPTPLEEVLRVRTLRQWDAATVVPRFGFADVDTYYREMSVGPRLRDLRVPALLVQSSSDPMVPPWTYERYLQQRPPLLRFEGIDTGGHVAFAAPMDLGSGPMPTEHAVLRWLRQQ